MKHKFAVVAKLGGYTGGPEALYQLGHALARCGADVTMVASGEVNQLVASDFEGRYGMSAVDEPEASPDAWLVLPEVEDPTEWRRRGWDRIIIWWLAAHRRHDVVKYRGCYHIFQSCHAQTQRAKDGFEGPVVSDYIRDDFVERASSAASAGRVGIGVNHRSALAMGIAAHRRGDTSLVLMSGLAPMDALGCMKRLKYYVDCGWHPGRDRMAREAALCGCIVIAGRQGAAGMPADMPLSDVLRMEDERPESLWERLEFCESNPEVVEVAMRTYREWVLAQKDGFMAEVSSLLKQIDQGRFHPVAQPVGTVTPEDYLLLANELYQARNMMSLGGSILIKSISRQPLLVSLRRLRQAARMGVEKLIRRPGKGRDRE